MLSSNNITAEQAENYYEKDDYYSQGMESKDVTKFACYWHGSGAKALGLTGTIDQNDFKQLLQGKDPHGNALHAKRIDLATHRAGTDFTFSAPKPVSIAALVQRDERVIEAHDRAVQVALDVMESRYSQARIWNPEKKQQEKVTTGNLTIGVFRHETSRNQDAQLHSHAVVLNATQTADGTWRALSNEEILNNKKLLGEIYQSELAYQLRQIGYEIELRPNGQFDLRGYDSQLLDCFSTRRQEIEAYVAQSNQPHTSKLYEQATLRTRSRKEVVPRDALMDSWHRVISEQGLTLPQLPQNVDKDLIKDGVDQATIAASAGILHAEEREAVFRRGKVERFAIENYLGQHSWSQLQTAINETNQLIRADVSSDKWTTQTAVQRELDTIRLMQAGRGKVESISTVEEVAAISPDTLTKGQRQALKLGATTTDQVIAWQGVAGAGKSFALNLYRQMAEAKGYTVRGFAVSAESAKVLEDEAHVSSATVASLLHSSIEAKDTIGKEIWLIDEAGLLGAKDAHALLKRAEQEHARVVLIGDTKQLAAIEAGSPFRSLQAAGIAIATLNESLRQKNQDLKRAVDCFATGDVSSGFDHLMKADAVHEIENQSDRHQAIIEEYLNLSSKQREKTLVIANTNAERLAITKGLRQALQADGGLGADAFTLQSLRTKDLTIAQANYARSYEVGNILIPVQTYKKQGLERGYQYEVLAIDPAQNRLTVRSPDGSEFSLDPAQCVRKSVYQSQQIQIAAGDRLRWCRNDLDKGIRNGQEFTIDAINAQGKAIVRYTDGKKDLIDLNGKQFADYSLVSTVYSSQGRTSDRVLASLDQTTGKEAFYVAISRAKYQLSLYSSDIEKLRQFAGQSKAKRNPSDYLNLFVYQEPHRAENQAGSQKTAARTIPHSTTANGGADRAVSVGSRVAVSLTAALSTSRRPTAAVQCPDFSAPTATGAADETRTSSRRIERIEGAIPRSQHESPATSDRSRGINRRSHRRIEPPHFSNDESDRSAIEPDRNTASGRLVSGGSSRHDEPSLGTINQQLREFESVSQGEIQRILQQLRDLDRALEEERNSRLKRREEQSRLAAQILPLAEAVFGYYVALGATFSKESEESTEYQLEIKFGNKSYLLSRDDRDFSHNVKREAVKMDVQAQANITITDVQLWQDFHRWLVVSTQTAETLFQEQDTEDLPLLEPVLPETIELPSDPPPIQDIPAAPEPDAQLEAHRQHYRQIYERLSVGLTHLEPLDRDVRVSLMALREYKTCDDPMQEAMFIVSQGTEAQAIVQCDRAEAEAYIHTVSDRVEKVLARTENLEQEH